AGRRGKLGQGLTRDSLFSLTFFCRPPQFQFVSGRPGAWRPGFIVRGGELGHAATPGIFKWFTGIRITRDRDDGHILQFIGKPAVLGGVHAEGFDGAEEIRLPLVALLRDKRGPENSLLRSSEWLTYARLDLLVDSFAAGGDCGARLVIG